MMGKEVAPILKRYLLPKPLTRFLFRDTFPVPFMKEWYIYLKGNGRCQITHRKIDPKSSDDPLSNKPIRTNKIVPYSWYGVEEQRFNGD